MLRKLQHIISLLLLASLSATAQNIRYVTKSGTYANDGKSWAQAKLNVQDAINDLVDHGLTGEVWVAAGTYTPTESTETSGGSTLYMSFKIPVGIKVYGGFAGTESSKEERATTPNSTIGWFYTHRTILSGDLSAPAQFIWNSSRKQWDTSFYGNCYHVVWFATNGFDEEGRAKALNGEAVLEGCVIMDGNAYNGSISGRPHNAYGGGIYMVEGAVVKNCYVKQCLASRDGGGVYMDGGGVMEHCYVADCQAVGIGVTNGYGGGVCLDANKSKTPFGLKQSGIVNSVGRLGGGLAIKVPHLTAADGTDIRYKPYASAVVVANNTATTEGGGVYMLKGGAISQMTIVNNQCNGTGVTLNGIVTGRAAGLYCRDNAYVVNSVLWGGECSENNDIQYASSHSSNSEALMVDMRFCSLSLSDYVDWSGTKKISVTSLSIYNDKNAETEAGTSSSSSLSYPMFKNPTNVKGHLDNGATALVNTYHYQPLARSSLVNAGLRTNDWDAMGVLPFGETLADVANNTFNARATLGAYTPEPPVITPQTTGNNINFYVHQDADEGENSSSIGNSWDSPIRFFSNAMYYISQHATEYAGKTVNVYVKEGTVNNTSSFTNGRVRMTSIDIPSNVNIYGGYPQELTGTNLTQTIDGEVYQRNPIQYPTVITGKITNEYVHNVAHLLKFDGCKNVLFDGFQVRYANASSTSFTNTNVNGGGMTFLNDADVRVNNTIIAGCTAHQGAAIYASGTSKAEFVNCIIHNNASSTLQGIIYSEGNSQLEFNHCNFLYNVGHAGYIKEGAVATQTYTNSVFFGNMNAAIDNISKEADGGFSKALPAFAGNTANATGSHCMFDSKSAQFSSQFGGNLGEWQYNLQYTATLASEEGYPRFLNPTKNVGVSPNGDATVNGRDTSFEPHNTNPIVNAASYSGDHTTWGTDITTLTTRDYGGLPDIGAVENHNTPVKITENDNTDGQPAYGVITYVRDYNTYTYDANGQATLVTSDLGTQHPDGTPRDGSSWANAINGNAPYSVMTTTTSYSLATPQTSTIANPSPFKIGMLSNNTPGNAVYYAMHKTGTYISNTTTLSAADDFILINYSSTYSYIYNLTKQMYVFYSNSGEGANYVYLSESAPTDANRTSALWRLRSVNTTANYRTYSIQPYSNSSNTTSSPSWNYHGGVSNNIGLYRSSDANSKWQFYMPVTTTTPTTINGLQYAVNTAEELMKPAYVTRTTTQAEKYSGGNVTTTHTYYDFTPTDANPQREVWVGAGIYTNPQGYELRNHVKVYGAFPKTGNPGKGQRHPQLTTGVSLSVENQGLNVNNFETILQTNSSTTQRDNRTYDVSVLRHPVECRVTDGDTSNKPQNRVRYEGAEWDGFTIRYGYKSSLSGSGTGGRRNGGSGLQLYEGVTVTNCVIRDNLVDNGTGNGASRGAGAYVDGSTLINCYIMNNIDRCTESDHYGGGLYMIKGTIYNSVIAGNLMQNAGGQGAGAFFESAYFYNNTVVNNTGAGALAVWTASGAEAQLTVYNSIIIAGTNKLIDRNNSTPISFKHSFLQSTQNAPTDTNYSIDERTQQYCGNSYNANTYHPFAKNYAEAIQNYDFRIVQKAAYNAVNEGTQFIGEGITLPDNDMDYTDRIQDCEVDMGAFEYNGAYSIAPDVTSVSGQAIFYVTPNGRGMASATDPANAACAAKLQKVLDAAGRYKFLNPDVRVVVKVANNSSLEGNGTPFHYYATRSTDVTDQDVRVWSIIVPRGIEVWGGYTDTFTSVNENGFYTNNGTYTDNRDITGHPTYFNSYYYNKKQKYNVISYHVVTFTEQVFDSEGVPYLEGDVIGQNSSYAGAGGVFKQMSSQTSDRAVIDGIYITGGNANMQEATETTAAKGINQYGGGAIVTDYAHVRNCILRNNQGIYGGALALTQNALVSGCLIDQNTAEYGGAIYVFEDGTHLSDGTLISTEADSNDPLDAKMPRVYTTTIVNNKANTQGGGIWFSSNKANVRVNSTVIWANDSQDQANVAGLSNPDKPTDDPNSTLVFYPFSYCAAQNVRLAGNKNLNVNNLNRMGVRFAKTGSTDGKTLAVETAEIGFAKYSDFGHYGLTNYSVLARTGMPVEDYMTLKSKGLADNDFKETNRFAGNPRSFIDIGARAIEKAFEANQLMLRLFVAQPENINMNAAEAMMDINTIPGTNGYNANVAYYAQEGSSFAYPMQNLQDALDYIYLQRSINPDGTLHTPDANNLPFEICIARGTYYPKRDLSGNYGFSLDNTFVLPEGVSLIGGFDCNEAVNEQGLAAGVNHFFGRYNVKGTIQTPVPGQTYYITDNVSHVDETSIEIVDEQGTIYTLQQLPTNTLIESRKHSDINSNNIIEPWEFTNQTELNGNAENVRNTGVLHVMSVYPDQTVVGALPTRSIDHSAAHNATIGTDLYGTIEYEEGQAITLDGLIISGGNARTYMEGAISDNGKFSYYHGGGLLVDGKRYCDDFNKHHDDPQGVAYQFANVSNAVAYRDIPIVINRCKFEDNRAGYGAAVSTNTTVDIFNSSFEHNKAESGKDLNVKYGEQTYEVSYPGHGGAIYATHQLSAFNTIFANNEAADAALNAEKAAFRSLRNQIIAGVGSDHPNTVIGGCGGAIYVAKHGVFHLVNCNFTRNMANVYPAVYTRNPNHYGEGAENYWTPQYSQITNSLFWGNEVNPDMMEKWKTNEYFKFASQLICNFGKTDRTGDYDPSFIEGNAPKNQEELDSYMETAWFSAYEAERGITTNNKADLRDIEYTPLRHVVAQLTEANDGTYQNCNITLARENDVEEGPNFVNPSTEAGYEGYIESADWSPARINNLTDNGSGKIIQEITSVNDRYQAEFVTYANDGEVPSGRSVYSIEGTGDYKTSGAYTTTRYLRDYRNYNNHLPLGTDSYMESAFMLEDGTHPQLYRISYDPNPTHNQTYIDIGVYEYPHTELQFQTVGDEVDILWVSPVEKPDNGLPDGSDWSQPTSDLQRAIETLLSSRNGHRKEIRLMDGVFTPIYNINDHLAFYIDTKYLNSSVTLPKNGETPILGEGVKSLTIKGGYSRELNNVYDVDEYPAIIRQQNRTDENSNRWDHLFYIGDITQRYGMESYSTANGHGWWTSSDRSVNTIPIEIDGVTFVNNQALSNTKGSAIHYADQMFNAESELVPNSPEYIATGPTPVNISNITYYKDEAHTIVSDVPTLFFEREGTKYYTDATYTTETTTPTQYIRFGYTENTNPAKLVLSKSTITGSGTHYDGLAQEDKSSSAVYIGKNGGYSLLYNNVLHSNYGKPLVSESQSITVNNTYALNWGSVDINGGDDDDKSVIYNSVFWRNNPAENDTYGTQFNLYGFTDVVTSGDIFKNNAFTGGETAYTDYTAGAISANNYNVGLSDNNTDVINGPNFIDPENVNVEKRNFMLKPSLRLLNKGDNSLYNDNLAGAYNIYDIAWLTTTRHDAGNNPRILFNIDLGAYEYQNNLERIIYVNPNATIAGMGNTWADPISYGGIQTAIDLAAVYHVNHPDKEAYVLVKGASQTNASLHTGETLMMRDGVSVYGGIHPSYAIDCAKNDYDDDANPIFLDSDIEAYIANIKATRGGIASPSGNKTSISGIKVSGHTTFSTENNITSIIDGFNITASTTDNPSGIVSQPLINVQPANTNAKVALRNIIVADNNSSATAGTDIAVVDNALIYEALFRNNTVANGAAVLRLGSNGYAVNITAEGKTVGADGTSMLNGGTEANSHIFNSIVNYAGTPATEQTLSGHNYEVDDKNLNYQLTERSQHIDECATTNPIGSITNLAEFINYATDRDLLGNPRLLNSVSSQNKIDRGAFETWRIDQATVTTTATDGFYPHDGSVVYIMENKNLIAGNSLTPAYLLLQRGASLYGNGQAVKAAYLGVERMVKHGGTMISMPYTMRYGTGVAAPSYDASNVLTLTTDNGQAYRYDGQSRSAWNKVFKTANSEDWGAALDDNDMTEANNGVRYHTAATTESLLRFTGKGTTMTDYIYTEEENALYKNVTLTQYDDRVATAGSADFTSKEDMGWNCFGLPYLVSNYSTIATETFTGSALHNMNIPHTLWLYYDGVTYPDGTTTANGDGGYYSVSSWTADDWHLGTGETATIWVGEGIFTQTAAAANKELLQFYRPVYVAPAPAKERKTAQRRIYHADGREEKSQSSIHITAKERVIYVTGLSGDEHITIYDSTGRVHNMGRATSDMYSTSVPVSGVFIVKVNEHSEKVLIK